MLHLLHVLHLNFRQKWRFDPKDADLRHIQQPSGGQEVEFYQSFTKCTFVHIVMQKLIIWHCQKYVDIPVDIFFLGTFGLELFVVWAH